MLINDNYVQPTIIKKMHIRWRAAHRKLASVPEGGVEIVQVFGSYSLSPTLSGSATFFPSFLPPFWLWLALCSGLSVVVVVCR